MERPSNLASMLERNATLVEYIAALPEEERVILTLHYLKNHSVMEIASRLGVPERSVSQVLAAGRARIASLFNPR
jgi:RNA polymerase sigma factor (sigma-70 family)